MWGATRLSGTRHGSLKSRAAIGHKVRLTLVVRKKKVGDRGDPANSCRSGDRGPRVAGTVGEREREVEKDRVRSERRIRLEGTREGFENRTG